MSERDPNGVGPRRRNRTSPSVDVLKVVSSIVVNALDAYEDDPAEYADWVAVHRTGNCDCH